jgi:tetratricopeptide (TPR) repeat protein
LKQVVSTARSGLATLIPLAVLTFATLLAFVNAWPNRLVFDDKAFAGPRRAAELDSWQYIFTHDVWAWTGSTFGLYRPLLLLQLSAETRVFGAWLHGYHLSNIFQHLVVTLLLYGFLQFLLRSSGVQSPTSRFGALLASLVFAVHPIHAEVVNSIFNRSEMMVAALALSGLWWLLYFLDRHPARAWTGLAITYFLAMLCRETALVIPGLAVILILMVRPGDLATRVRKCLPVLWLLLPLVLYLLLRANAVANPHIEVPGLATPEPVAAIEQAESDSVPEMLNNIKLPDFETLLEASAALGTAFRVVAWPHPLQLMYGGFSSSELWAYAALHLILIITALVLLKRRRYAFAAGLAFFYLAMLPASRIIAFGEDAGSHFADRYAYVPTIGLAIILAFAFQAVSQRISPRALVRITLPVLLLLTGLTWARNAEWRSDVALFGVEYERSRPNANTLRWLTGAHVRARNFARVVQICDDNQAKQEKYGYSTYVQSCATAYEHQRRFEDAERAHLYAIEYKSTRIAASMSLARFYLRHARPLDAEKRFTAAIAWTTDPADKALSTAEMIISLNPNNREQAVIARGYIEEALQLRPGWLKAETMLAAVEKALASSRDPLTGKVPPG